MLTQILNSYGAKSNDNLLLFYGFTEIGTLVYLLY